MDYRLNILFNGHPFDCDHPEFDNNIERLMNCRSTFHYDSTMNYIEFSIYDFHYMVDYKNYIEALEGFTTIMAFDYDDISYTIVEN